MLRAASNVKETSRASAPVEFSGRVWTAASLTEECLNGVCQFFWHTVGPPAAC